ncbi:FxsB family radical SAM/SPASM domain protein [Actinomadura logoneensis]|uniref:FxsB family radical SAM/SPASM domain protein n=1 Tax=Actinomadura logoneensis TaxID=2293572 RepID=A0A372JJH2_9ACTN|nr:FxsB family cyclophane-forming radical SAM/SPASM peptide maturase [Actinomadura logoneensis]RFU40167.1 FxsB family radical SAM/SPASM domain protein [Actinomadura logoneensis]
MITVTGELPPPPPLRQFILKLHGRCNLACDYCYVYAKSDQRWRHRPPLMAPATVRAAADRIAEHVRAHRLPDVSVVLHGGEPLLAGPRRVEQAVRTVRDTVGARVDFSVQTNGTLLNDRFLRLFDELDVLVGVSLDGDQATHDLHRRTPHGGSHDRVLRGLAALTAPRHRHLFGGLLCVVDVTRDPLTVWDALRAFDPPAVDLLLPHATWTTPPAAPPGAHAAWLTAVFDRWFAEPPAVRVRLFEEIVNVLLGGSSALGSVGTTPPGMVVIETDGAIEQCGSLATAYEGAADLGLDVVHHDFDTVLRHPAVVARRRGEAGVPTPCRPCRWATTCGGGHPTHRYRHPSGFDHRSVYCTDLDLLYTHIHKTLQTALAAPTKAPTPR